MSEPLILVGRRSSHFTRVATMFAHELGLTFTLQVLHELTSKAADLHGGNPALKIPTLQIGALRVFGTENICRKLIALAGRRNDTQLVLPEVIENDQLRCAQELVWSAMSAQVQLRVGINVCHLPADNAYFAKVRAGMIGVLQWLDLHLAKLIAELPAARQLSLFEVSLFCLIEHIAFLPTVSLYPYRNLSQFAAAYAERASAGLTKFSFDAPPGAP